MQIPRGAKGCKRCPKRWKRFQPEPQSHRRLASLLASPLMCGFLRSLPVGDPQNPFGSLPIKESDAVPDDSILGLDEHGEPVVIWQVEIDGG